MHISMNTRLNTVYFMSHEHTSCSGKEFEYRSSYSTKLVRISVRNYPLEVPRIVEQWNLFRSDWRLWFVYVVLCIGRGENWDTDTIVECVGLLLKPSRIFRQIFSRYFKEWI